jgi:crossover junction endodeoxyribonuclease RusA
MYKLTLPYPPSLNHAHYNVKGGGRVLTAKARTFYANAAVIARSAGVERIEGDVVVTLYVYRAATNEDAENRAKFTLDALQGIAYDNDKQIVEIHIYRKDAEQPKRKNARVEIEVRAA